MNREVHVRSLWEAGGEIPPVHPAALRLTSRYQRGLVCDEKTNMCEPLLTHRNETTTASKPGPVGGPGTKARHGEPSVGELPVCGPGGVRCIGGVSSSQALAWNRRTCRPDSDDQMRVKFARWSREGEPQAADTASGRVPMRGTGADRLVVAMMVL
jgi:hypothetical protein